LRKQKIARRIANRESYVLNPVHHNSAPRQHRDEPIIERDGFFNLCIFYTDNLMMHEMNRMRIYIKMRFCLLREGRLTGEQHLTLVIRQVDVLGVSRFSVHGRLHYVVTCSALSQQNTSQVIALSF